MPRKKFLKKNSRVKTKVPAVSEEVRSSLPWSWGEDVQKLILAKPLASFPPVSEGGSPDEVVTHADLSDLAEVAASDVAEKSPLEKEVSPGISLPSDVPLSSVGVETPSASPVLLADVSIENLVSPVDETPRGLTSNLSAGGVDLRVQGTDVSPTGTRRSMRQMVGPPRTKNIVVPSKSAGSKKRKRESEEEKDPDFVENVAIPVVSPSPAKKSPAPKKAKKFKIAVKKKGSGAYDSDVFVSKAAAERLSSYSVRSLLAERSISVENFREHSDLVPLLEESGLLMSVSGVKGYLSSVVYEFYANLSSEISDSSSGSFETVFVRGCSYEFGPTQIGQFLGLHAYEESGVETPSFDEMVKTLTGGRISCWPDGKSFPASYLTARYSLLHKIALSNWMSSAHLAGVKKSLAKLLYCIGSGIPVNMAQLIFDQIVSFAESEVTFSALIFPSLIFNLLDSQQPFERGSEKLVPPRPAMKISAQVLKKLEESQIEGESSQSADAVLEDQIACLKAQRDSLTAVILKLERLKASLALRQ